MTPILATKLGNNADLFPDILKLHVPEGSRVLDMTYGTGVFWKKVDTSRYDLFTNDLDPDRGQYSHDLRHFPPYWRGWFDAVVLDPPYKLTGTKYEGDQYGNPSSGYKYAWDLYAGGIAEAAWLLAENGILIVKCMDQVCLHKQNWMHIFVYEQATGHGMTAIDLFILVRPSARPQPHANQVHAHKNHSFFWVFRND